MSPDSRLMCGLSLILVPTIPAVTAFSSLYRRDLGGGDDLDVGIGLIR